MRQPRIAVTYANGHCQEVVVPLSAAQLYSDAHGEAFTRAMLGLSCGWLEELAYYALVRRQGETRGLTEWLATVDQVDDITPDLEEDRPWWLSPFGGDDPDQLTENQVRAHARAVTRGGSVQFKLTYQDERTEVVRVIPLARRQFEEEHEKPLLDAMAEGYGGWGEELVWRTLVIRTGEGRSLEDWLRQVDAIELAVEAEDVREDADDLEQVT